MRSLLYLLIAHHLFFSLYLYLVSNLGLRVPTCAIIDHRMSLSSVVHYPSHAVRVLGMYF